MNESAVSSSVSIKLDSKVAIIYAYPTFHEEVVSSVACMLFDLKYSVRFPISFSYFHVTYRRLSFILAPVSLSPLSFFHSLNHEDIQAQPFMVNVLMNLSRYVLECPW